MADEKEALGKEFNTLREEITSLKNTLDEIDAEKEKWFKKKEDLKLVVNQLISKIKNVREEKDDVRDKVEEFKKEREKYNSKVRALIANIKNLYNQKSLLSNKKVKDPEIIKKKIESIEYSIEHEALSFNKEKKLMEEIKKLKKEYNESSEGLSLVKNIDQVSKEIEENKEKAGDYHKMIQGLLVEGQSYEEFIKISKEINETRKEQEDAFEKFIGCKRNFKENSEKLKAKLKSFSKIKKKLNKIKKRDRQEKEENQTKELDKKEQEVYEKLKRGEKLTKEDLLVYQNGDDKQ